MTELPPLPEPDIQSFGGLASYSHFRMHAYGQACQAATLATVTPLVQHLVEGMECLVLQKPLDDDMRKAFKDARAFLSGATKGEPS